MCGRFALGIPKKRLEEIFSVEVPQNYSPRYNLAPGQEVLVVPSGSDALVFRNWGLVPSWAEDRKIGYKMINSRSETVFDKPAFRESVRSARCLVPAQAFYEWKITGSGKQPFAIGPVNGEVFAMAGIMAHWEDQATGEVVDSFSILTCAPNTLMDSIHDRMPVILPATRWHSWLDPSCTDVSLLESMLVPYPSKAMQLWPVSTVVNKVSHDGSELLDRVDVMRQASLF